MKLILENKDGKVLRTFNVQGDEGVVVARRDNRRVEVVTSVASLDAKRIQYKTLGEISRATLEKQPMAIAGAKLRVVGGVAAEPVRNVKMAEEDPKEWYRTLSFVAGLQVLFLLVLLVIPKESKKLDEEMKQQVVQIVKRIPPPQERKVIPQPTQTTQKQISTKTSKVVTRTTKTATVKRMGALSVFGSMKNGSQRGGVNLGQVNTSSGPGLGGTGGSGGVQTTLYGKGLVAAPLGAGSNMQGGGGYGTKGKGGGKAGYGKLSLIGSAGTSTIPLGREALIEGGLDRDLIADVINRNMGQIRFCYEQGLQGDPSLAGRVAVRFTIGGNGTVRSAGVANTTLGSNLVEDCIVRRLRSWKFPLPEGGVDVGVTYPFVLKRAGG